MIRFVELQINNGLYTERALARTVGVSQPQIHHVLKGMRKLTPELADRLLWKFEIDVLFLLDGEELDFEAAARSSQGLDETPRKAPIRETVSRRGASAESRSPKTG